MSAPQRDESTSTAIGVEALAREGRWAGTAHSCSPSPSGDHDFHRAPPQLVEVMCECGQLNCTGNIVMSLDEYEAVRLHPTRFLIKEGHEVPDVVRVVGHGTEYVVVAKFDTDSGSAFGSL